VNHVLSFCRYIQSLPDTSERLPSTLNVLEPLVHGLWNGLRPDDASGSTGRMGKHLLSDSRSVLKPSVYPRLVNFKQVSEMTSVLLRALFHIGNATAGLEAGNAIGVLEDFLHALAEKMTSKDESVLGKSRSGLEDRVLTWFSSATALTILTACHEHVLNCPIALQSSSQVSRLVSAFRRLASEQVISNLEAVNSNPSPVSSPTSTSDRDGDINIRLDESMGPGSAPYVRSHRRRSSAFPLHFYEQIAILRRFSGMDLVLLVLDMQGAIMCQSLAPIPRSPANESPVVKGEQRDEHFASNASWHSLNHTPVQEVAASLKLGRSAEGHVALQDVASAAVKWWEEIMHGSGIGLGVGIARRFGERGQGSFGGGLDYGENAVMIAILVSAL
jgi:hypothetical protein